MLKKHFVWGTPLLALGLVVVPSLPKVDAEPMTGVQSLGGPTLWGNDQACLDWSGLNSGGFAGWFNPAAWAAWAGCTIMPTQMGCGAPAPAPSANQVVQDAASNGAFDPSTYAPSNPAPDPPAQSSTAPGGTQDQQPAPSCGTCGCGSCAAPTSGPGCGACGGGCGG